MKKEEIFEFLNQLENSKKKSRRRERQFVNKATFRTHPIDTFDNRSCIFKSVSNIEVEIDNNFAESNIFKLAEVITN